MPLRCLSQPLRTRYGSLCSGQCEYRCPTACGVVTRDYQSPAGPLSGPFQPRLQLISECLLFAGEQTQPPRSQGPHQPPGGPSPSPPHAHFIWCLQTEPGHLLLCELTHAFQAAPEASVLWHRLPTKPSWAVSNTDVFPVPMAQSPQHCRCPNRMWGCRSPEGRSQDLGCIPRT